MSDPVEAGVDAGLMAVADAVMDANTAKYWRKYSHQRAFRDAIYAALLAERRRAGEAMRERAAALVDEGEALLLHMHGPGTKLFAEILGAIAADVRALPSPL
jgi:hypothetical protein